jgi:hypothetical protein
MGNARLPRLQGLAQDAEVLVEILNERLRLVQFLEIFGGGFDPLNSLFWHLRISAARGTSVYQLAL